MRRGSPSRTVDRGGLATPKRQQLPQIGKKGREWQAIWRRLKPRFERAGITRCEVRGEKCQGSQYLTPAHSLKRRNCVTAALLSEVVIACVNCHAEIEILKEADMCAKVRAIIDARPNPI